MLTNQNEKVVKTLYNIELVTTNKNKENQISKKVSNLYIGKKIPRNSPCPCGSGKKYKHCHGA